LLKLSIDFFWLICLRLFLSFVRVKEEYYFVVICIQSYCMICSIKLKVVCKHLLLLWSARKYEMRIDKKGTKVKKHSRIVSFWETFKFSSLPLFHLVPEIVLYRYLTVLLWCRCLDAYLHARTTVKLAVVYELRVVHNIISVINRKSKCEQKIQNINMLLLKWNWSLGHNTKPGILIILHSHHLN
jgi:hypothetical protein